MTQQSADETPIRPLNSPARPTANAQVESNYGYPNHKDGIQSGNLSSPPEDLDVDERQAHEDAQLPKQGHGSSAHR